MRSHWEDFDQDDEIDWMRHDTLCDVNYYDYRNKKSIDESIKPLACASIAKERHMAIITDASGVGIEILS